MRRSPAVVTTPLAALVLASAVLAGCGTGSNAPTDAGVAEFCDAATALDDEDGSGSERAHEVGEQLEAVGTPDGTPETARAGFEIQVELLTTSGDDGADARDLSDDELNLLTAYSEFVSSTCTA
ncbi:hypothetical protein [Nocardioides sp. CFH 31398]|uniref:hypothetical protein n=1 Tax=Nocardioides sp. CFH 31398 TaxID=2919579 RepID=UPI001F05AA76|nr:hypothetical protein [Nocardioides sp. CFH 31398]MCH1866349.1 hypothetical protein [Nocardioides sp. CFH 31398]